MSAETLAEQFFNVVPPRDTQCVALAVSGTAAHQDMTALNLFAAYDAHKKDTVEITMIADGGNVYINFSAANVTIDPTITSGQATKVPFLLPQGVPMRFRINKLIDLVLNYIASTGTPTLRLYASSHLSQQGVGSQ